MITKLKAVPCLLLALSAAVPRARGESGAFTEREIAAARQDPDRFTLDEGSLSIQTFDPEPAPRIPSPLPSPSDGNGAIDPVLIVNIAEKLWDIIEKNKPVVDIKTQYAVAIPAGTVPAQLSGWRQPEASVYGFSAKNLYGLTVVDLKYMVLRTYGGSYEGKGKYLTNITIEPVKTDVSWGYRFSLAMEAPDTSIVNVGTDEDPVAAIMANLKWRIQTPLSASQGIFSYYLQGDGLLRDVLSGASAARAARRTVDKLGRLAQTPIKFD